ncbi:superfamily II DNA or RNA helicase [Pedobacter sp. AK013]|uniref:SNF2-related protein n=1 Tax=Pedobacter sp. AK013 TaxID=2723071 RepID=UPI0016172AB2|nr:SNF2-related protein [Pedobacter sp. AK013]MBB6239943.1 superfamily II DNA or RNA helicase [Pedobacter sp. AK013]
MCPNTEDNQSLQITIDFDTPKWPDQSLFPLNLKALSRTVRSVVYTDIEESSEYIIITGFTSLSNLIDLFGTKDFKSNRLVRILIGFEPNIKGRKKYPRLGLDKEIKDYWLKRGLSIMQGGAVMHLIDKINRGLLEFRFRDKLHAKIYVGDQFAVMGSSNFSNNGLASQEEANIRVKNNYTNPFEQQQYKDIKLIADSYYEDSEPYNEKVIDLLRNLISKASWEEALARAIAEVLEGNWLNEYKDIISKLERTRLWPTQWKGLAQAISILQSHSNVLIADPTGAGKTKLCTSVVLSLQHWLYDIGKNYRTESVIVCPPLVLEKWGREFKAFNRINHTQISHGLLSNSTGQNRKKLIEDLNLANILVIDEAHNYLSSESNRTNLIKDNRADYKILVTATPISRKVEDILRLIDLLDVDNLTDIDFINYQELVLKPYLRNKPENIRNLRKFISKFTVRRTKKGLNKEIEKDEKSYHNNLGATCKFPKQRELTYSTTESKKDKEIVHEINELSKQIKGITYLTRFNKPKFEVSSEDTLRSIIQQRLHGSKQLSIYVIRARLRSSKVALVEHIEGSKKAMEEFEFDGKNNDSGDKLGVLRKILESGELPSIYQKFKKEYFPDWLTDIEAYQQACQREYDIYNKISQLAKKLSNSRELGKVAEMALISAHHDKILAFDSTVITLYYFRKLFLEHYPEKEILVASGSETDAGSQKIMEYYRLESEHNGKCIALCSDKMSESVDLQKASCVFLLDTPSVLRVVEQRIGRADRMDSMHAAIDIYWPVDSEEYAMKTDERLFATNEMVEQIYGANFDLPEALKERRFEQLNSTKDMIREFKEFVDKDESWTGIHDSFQFIVDLKEGKTALIKEELYEQFRNVSSEVKTKVSFIKCESNWCFIALRGGKNKSPRWYFIDGQNDIHTDYPDVCQHLREGLSGESVSIPWDQDSLRQYIVFFRTKERELLPPKKKRALEVVEYILIMKLKNKKIDADIKVSYQEMLNAIMGKSNEVFDYERLAEEWIQILQPILKRKRELLRRKKTILNLASLKNDYKEIQFEPDQLSEMIEGCILGEDIDKRIAACIIGISNNTLQQTSEGEEQF